MNLRLGKWRIHRSPDRETAVEVSERDGVRSLHLGSSTVQSSMTLADPTELVLSYTRTMMGFLLFDPAPRHVAMVGLGGGSLAKFIYHRLPDARITAIEANPQVISVARSHFHVPMDDARLRVVLGQGESWVAEPNERCDVLLVDGYDGNAQADGLSTEDFYMNARRRLEPDGLLVVNLWSSDRRLDAYLQRMERCFEACLCLPAERRGNIVALGFCRPPRLSQWGALRTRAKELEGRLGLEFTRMVEALKETNPHDHKGLIFQATAA
jgi:spermidine synthase